MTASIASAENEIDLTQSYGTKVLKVDGSKASKSLTVNGNFLNNTITGGKVADTIYGGAGTNTLTGGAGSDVFYISTGKNYITDYKSGEDTLYLSSGYVTSSTVKSSNVILNISTGSEVTIKSGKGKKITFLNSNNTTTTQTYSKTLDLFEDNNYISDEPQLSTITEQKYSVTQVQTPNYSALEQYNKTFLTFAKK